MCVSVCVCVYPNPIVMVTSSETFKKNDEKSIRIKNLATTLSSKYNVEIDVLLIAWILKHP